VAGLAWPPHRGRDLRRRIAVDTTGQAPAHPRYDSGLSPAPRPHGVCHTADT